MSKQRKTELQRAIIEIEKPYPKDDLILTYSDFLKVRDFLGYYQFNPVVFDRLINLANDSWNTKKRISRLSLLQKIKQYLKQNAPVNGLNRKGKPSIQLNVESKKILFNLFRKTVEEWTYLSPIQLEEARRTCNHFLINLELTPKEEEWLCANFKVSEFILNRVLRYPVKSAIISDWASRNFNNDKLRGRRAELISWIIDREPEFEIDPQTLLDDFEYLNKSDLKAIQDYDDEIAANQIIEQEFGDYLPKKTDFDFFDGTYEEEKVDLSAPELKLSRRPYAYSIDTSKDYPVLIPNFKKLRVEFRTNLHNHHKITMIWAIAYSRLDNTLKSALLKKYYGDETYTSLYRVARRTDNVELLKWILEQQ